MFNFLKKPSKEIFLVRIFKRQKIGRGYADEWDYKALDSHLKAENYILKLGLKLDEFAKYQLKYISQNAKGTIGWAGFIDKLEVE